eukprot:5386931-Pleurochrysis_carterae.AAC.1
MEGQISDCRAMRGTERSGGVAECAVRLQEAPLRLLPELFVCEWMHASGCVQADACKRMRATPQMYKIRGSGAKE